MTLPKENKTTKDIPSFNAYALKDVQKLPYRMAEWQEKASVMPHDLSDLSNLPRFLFPRVCGWMSNGIDAQQLISTLNKLENNAIPGSPPWIKAFADVAQKYKDQSTLSKEKEDKLYQLIQAASFYYLSRWPHVFSDAAYESFQESIKMYEEASQYFDCTFNHIFVPYNHQLIKAHLYIPPRYQDSLNPPIVIVNGGMDVWKFDPEVQTVIMTLLTFGFAVCAVDMPGTGENPIPLSPNAVGFYQSLIQELQARKDLDTNRMGFYGLSFGGHWSVRSAFMFSDIKAAVNVGGPINLAFQADHYAKLEIGARKNIAKCFSMDLASFDPKNFMDLALEVRHKTSPSQPYLLSINGALDELVPIEEIAYLQNLGLQQDTLIFSDDRHVASFKQKLHLPFAAKWLQDRLST